MLAVSFALSTERTPWILSKIFLAGAHDLLSLVSFTMLSEHESSYFRLVTSSYWLADWFAPKNILSSSISLENKYAIFIRCML